jgi:hypothetical protein
MDEVRRLIVLLVVALVGATVFGLSSGSSGLGVNGARVSGNTFRSELATISTTPILQCYLTALDPVDFGEGGGSQTMAASGAAAWTRLRIEGLSITQYAKSHLKFAPTAKTLSSAESSLVIELTNASAAATKKCQGTAAAALAAMPTEMRNAEIEDQAASLYLVSKLDGTIPLTNKKDILAYYNSHAADYDTLCVSIAVVPLSQTTAFATAQTGGESVADLAKQFSIDSSKTKGGVAGCFTPSEISYEIRSDVATTALNSFATTPLYINDNGTEEALFVAPTKRTVNPFAQAESAVLADVQSQNASAANTEEESILSRDAIDVAPAFGQWVLESTGPTVLVPSLPAKVDVTGNKSLTTRVITYH